MSSALIIPSVVRQHAEEASVLADTRALLVAAPHLTLPSLTRFDSRLAAHLDGLTIGGASASAISTELAEEFVYGGTFTATVLAIVSKEHRAFEALLSSACNVPRAQEGVIGALGWLEPEQLRGVVAKLLDSSSPVDRMIGLSACAYQRVDPHILSWDRVREAEPPIRARALEAAGELGLLGADTMCAAALDAEDSNSRFWAAWSLVMLGDRGQRVKALINTAALQKSEKAAAALRLFLQMMDREEAHRLLEQLAQEPLHLRSVIQGAGIVGDVTYVGWLIRHMSNLPNARLAGEAFGLITGIDLSKTQMDRPRPTEFEGQPNDNPEDLNVDMDPDDGLPWPDVKKIEVWWHANSGRFQKGTRYFMGKPVTREHCIDVLKNGYQRQRILAAHYLCLLEPGTPLFNTSAPAWRQQRLLAAI
jgi:uncharacterized protein (TIGR02270 family)